jgi:hypothetical protein
MAYLGAGTATLAVNAGRPGAYRLGSVRFGSSDYRAPIAAHRAWRCSDHV